ncbi:hypothetical protein ACGF07_31860 [Kitasatospora sp. NPDC048194]|uniref:hypothetical protein n=1 Tax=Kitasatospora sp. NPDC048194 TaxID=3364045 RepID=UPI0037200F95
MTGDAFGIEEFGAVLRGAPAKAVTIFRGMAFGGVLVHALDHLVLTHLLFAIASGEEITPQIVWKRLQSLGIVSAKREDVLVGREAVYASFARIIAAGYIHRVQLPHKNGGGRKGPVVYLAYEDPADNPDHGQATTSPETLARAQAQADAVARAKSQVTPQTGYREAVPSDSATNGVSAGQTANRVAVRGAAASGYPGRGEKVIPAGQTANRVAVRGEAAPPHTPPEGETPPTPRTTTAPPASADAVPGGGGVRSANGKNPAKAEREARLAAASEFLRNLPGAWECGIGPASRLAPLLVRVCTEQGWALGPELVAVLTEEKKGARPVDSYPATLKYRIGELKRYRGPASAGEPAGEQPPTGPTEPCEFHPNREASSCLICRSGPDFAAPEVAEVPVDTDDQETDAPDLAQEIKDLLVRSARAIPSSRRARTRDRGGRAAGLAKRRVMDAEAESAERAEQLAALDALMQSQGA